MIVTRQRKKKQSSLPILLPIAAIAMLAIALTWPPSRNFITNGPLKPVATVFDGIWGVVSRPLSFAYQQQQITDRNTRSSSSTTSSRPTARPRPTRTPRSRSSRSRSRPTRPSPSPRRRRPPSRWPGQQPPGAAAGAAGGRPLLARRRTRSVAAAQQWAAMDPEKAAALVEKLPTSYVSAVFAQMSPDAVGPIMDALPAKVAALIVESGTNPQISAQAGR